MKLYCQDRARGLHRLPDSAAAGRGEAAAAAGGGRGLGPLLQEAGAGPRQPQAGGRGRAEEGSLSSQPPSAQCCLQHCCEVDTNTKCIHHLNHLEVAIVQSS